MYPGHSLTVLCPLAQNKNDAFTLIALGKKTNRIEKLKKLSLDLKNRVGN